MGFILLGAVIGLIVAAVRLWASRDLRKAEGRSLKTARRSLRRAEEKSLKTGKPVPQGVRTRAQRAEMQAQAWAHTSPKRPSLASVTGSAPVTSATKEQRVKYEYKVVGFRNEGSMGVQSTLNRLGKQGWEITTSTHAGSLDFAKNRYTVTLRRVRS